MDHRDYERQIRQLETQLNNLDTSKEQNDATIGAVKRTGLITYWPYALISLASFVLLYIFQPKRVLKVVVIDETPTMVLDTGRLIIWWLIWSFGASIVYLLWTRFRKPRTEE